MSVLMSNVKFTGTVVRGKQLGRTIGFPTANIEPDGPAAAESGVYIAEVSVAGGAPLPCMVNQGRHPTAPEGPPTIEAHILGFSGDIYGCRVEMEYLEFLRPERKFPSLDALRAQLDEDLRAAKAYFE